MNCPTESWGVYPNRGVCMQFGPTRPARRPATDQATAATSQGSRPRSSVIDEHGGAHCDRQSSKQAIVRPLWLLVTRKLRRGRRPVARRPPVRATRRAVLVLGGHVRGARVPRRANGRGHRWTTPATGPHPRRGSSSVRESMTPHARRGGAGDPAVPGGRGGRCYSTGVVAAGLEPRPDGTATVFGVIERDTTRATTRLSRRPPKSTTHQSLRSPGPGDQVATSAFSASEIDCRSVDFRERRTREKAGTFARRRFRRRTGSAAGARPVRQARSRPRRHGSRTAGPASIRYG
jgi:hypothetical protein